MNDCLFCRIASRQESAAIVYEDNDIIAFLDIRPLFHGHTLVIPKCHADDLHSLEENATANFFIVIKKLSAAIISAMQSDGTFVAMNNIVSQSVRHFHVHIVPRKKGDGLKGFFWPRKKYSGQQMEEVRARIAATVDAGLKTMK